MQILGGISLPISNNEWYDQGCIVENTVNCVIPLILMIMPQL